MRGAPTWRHQGAFSLPPAPARRVCLWPFESGAWPNARDPRPLETAHASCAPGTTITVAPDLHDFSGAGYYVGIDASSRSGFSLRDLSLSVLPQGASGTFANRGISVYGVHLAGCSDYSFSRVSIMTGAASGG